MLGPTFDVIGWLIFMLNVSSICSRILQFIRYRTFLLLIRICLISCCGFPLCYFMIYVLMDLLLDKWHSKRRDSVVVVKSICLNIRETLFSRPLEFLDSMFVGCLIFLLCLLVITASVSSVSRCLLIV